MHGNIPYMCDCWPLILLFISLLLKSSMLVIYVPVYLLSVSASSQMSVNKIKFMIREGVQNYYFFVFVEKSEILGRVCFIFVFSKQ